MVKVMKKRVIAVLLAIFTIATLICVPAVADEGAEPENPKLTPSFEWYTKNPDANTFYISSAEEFLGLCELTWDETHRTVKKLGIDPVDFEGKTVELTADINLNPGWEWSVKIDEKGKVTCVDALQMFVTGWMRFTALWMVVDTPYPDFTLIVRLAHGLMLDSFIK